MSSLMAALGLCVCQFLYVCQYLCEHMYSRRLCEGVYVCMSLTTEMIHTGLSHISHSPRVI